MAIGVGKRVLVVEDNADVRKLLSELLGAHGYVVTGTATGAEGIAAALSSPPDLIIVDLCLPDDDGLSVSRALLSNAGLAGVPVITISTSYPVQTFDPERLVEAVRLLTGG